MIHCKGTGFTSSILMISLTDTGYGETFVSELCGKHTRWELESRQGQALFLRLRFPQENKSPPRVPGMVTGKRNSQFPIPPGQSHWVGDSFPTQKIPLSKLPMNRCIPRRPVRQHPYLLRFAKQVQLGLHALPPQLFSACLLTLVILRNELSSHYTFKCEFA